MNHTGWWRIADQSFYIPCFGISIGSYIGVGFWQVIYYSRFTDVINTVVVFENYKQSPLKGTCTPLSGVLLLDVAMLVLVED